MCRFKAEFKCINGEVDVPIETPTIGSILAYPYDAISFYIKHIEPTLSWMKLSPKYYIGKHVSYAEASRDPALREMFSALCPRIRDFCLLRATGRLISLLPGDVVLDLKTGTMTEIR